MFVHFEFYFLGDVIGVDEPYEGDEEGGDEEHDGLLLDDSVLMWVEVFEGDGFNCQGHQGGGEEHA